MTVDKSWIHLSTRSCTEYINGVENFLEYAFKHSIDGDKKSIVRVLIVITGVIGLGMRSSIIYYLEV